MATEQRPPRRAASPSVAEAIEAAAPWKPPPWEPQIATAFQALMRGDCPPHLQIQAMNWLMNDVCKIRDLAYRPGTEGERDTTFALGKQFVGHQIAKMLTTNVKPRGEQG